MANKIFITLDVDDKGSATMKKFGGNADQAFDKLKKNAKDGATQAGTMERAWKTSTDHLKSHWKAYAVAGVAAIYGVTKMISGAIDKMKEYVGLANIQEAAEKKLEAVLTATGNAAGYNLDQLKNMASGMQAVTTVGDEVILSGMAILATFKQIKGEGFERATKAALDMSAVMGQDLKSSMVMIGKAVNDPITGMSMLTRVGVTFTQQQKDMAKQMQESGDMAGAQNVILKELESQFGGTAAALREDFGGAVTAAGNALGDTKEEMGFLITKNQFFIDIVHLAEKQFIAWGEKIKENRGYLQDLLKRGVLALVDGVIFAVKTMRFFHNAWLGIKLVGSAALQAIAWLLEKDIKMLRFFLAPLDLIFEGLKKIGMIKVNPFDQVEKAFGQFKASSADVTKEVMADIAKTNKTYDLVIGAVEGWQKQIKAIPVEQAKTEKQITKSIKQISKVQATATKEEIKAAKDAAAPKEQIKAMQAQEAFAIKMANAELQRIKDRAQLKSDTLESFRTAKMPEIELASGALDKQFLAYDAFVQDKAALDSWYVEKYDEIMADADSKRLQLRIAENQRTLENTESLVEGMAATWENYALNTEPVIQQVSKLSVTMAQNFAAGVGDAFAQAVVYGESLSKAFADLTKQLAAQVIQSLIAIGVERLIQFVVAKALGVAQATSRMAILSAETFAAAFASTCAIPIVGPFMAPGVAAGALATMQAGSVAAGATGAAMGAGIASFDRGGISEAEGIYRTGPIREAHIPIPSGGKIPVKIEDRQQSISRAVNIYIYGDVVDHDKFAREIVPSIQKALDDGVH